MTWPGKRRRPLEALEFSEGLFWPVGTRQIIKDLIHSSVTDMQPAVDLARERRVVVQAGGHVGYWPKWLASRFQSVITFEPESKNFAAMDKNVTEPNVSKHQAALGEQKALVGLRLSPKNNGAHRVEGIGNVLMLPVDALKLPVCDLIILDVEGYEFPVLRGAVKTLKAHKPVLMLEDRGLGKKTGNGKFIEIVNWLRNFGYEEKVRLQYDAIFA